MSGLFPTSGVAPAVAVNGVDVPTTCTAAEELFYSTSVCNPRFDAAAMNAVMSEILNFVQCAGNSYDCSSLSNMCQAMTTYVTRAVGTHIFDGIEFTTNAGVDPNLHVLPVTASTEFAPNDQIYIRRNNVVHRVPATEIFETICVGIPSVANECGELTQVALSTDATGCPKLVTYSTADAALSTTRLSDDVGNNFSDIVPATPNDLTSYYALNDLGVDFQAGTIDDNLLESTRFMEADYTTTCDNVTVNIDLLMETVLFSPTANGGNGQLATVVYKIDGVLQGTVGTVQVARLPSFTNFVGSYNENFNIVIPTAGAHTVEFFIIRIADNLPATQVRRITTANGTGTGSVTVSKALGA